MSRGRKRDQNELFHMGRFRGVDEIQLPLVIDAFDRIALLPRQRGRRRGDDRGNAPARRIERRAILQIAKGELYAELLQPLLLPGARRGPHEGPDGLPLPGKQATNLAAEKSGGTRDQSHRHLTCGTRAVFRFPAHLSGSARRSVAQATRARGESRRSCDTIGATRGRMLIHVLFLSALLVATAAFAQPGRPAPTPPPGTTNDPFPTPIPATEGVIKVKFAEFAAIPDVGPEAARTMHLIDEAGTRRLFVSDMRGILYTVSYDGKTVTPYLDLRDQQWAVGVQSQGNERGFQSFAFHPQFSRRGSPGFGKFYTYTDTSNTTVKADFVPGGGTHTHDTVLLEWTAKTPDAATYDGAAAARAPSPRAAVREPQRRRNHVQPAGR